MKKSSVISVVVIALLCVLLLSMCNGGTSSGGRGNGTSTCRNCGRNKPLSALGYCSTCQDGFDKWQKKTYGK